MFVIEALIANLGLLIVFSSVFIDQAGIPLPCYPVLLIAGAMATTTAAMTDLLAVGVAATLSADLLWYFAGMRFGRRILNLICKIALSPDSCIRRTEDTFAKYGAWTLPFAKFLPGLGYVAVALSGIIRLNLLRFVAFDALGAIAFISVPVLIGRLFHNAVGALLTTLYQLGGYGAVLIVVLLALYIGTRLLERQSFARHLRMARISIPELCEMMRSPEPPIILDVREQAARQRDGMIPGAVAADFSALDEIARSYAPDDEVIVYCACPNEASAAVAALHLKRAGFTNIRPLFGGFDAWVAAGLPLEHAVADAELALT
ncbi:MAG: DedA family protein/thiosulfate sulfurtransferase GlpE [Alphaproteobacteria bacterium]|nr:DedA family protein/thiosulfate sulfurtransferase GlpE [Alphaproteobacteria bacterium]